MAVAVVVLAALIAIVSGEELRDKKMKTYFNASSLS